MGYLKLKTVGAHSVGKVSSSQIIDVTPSMTLLEAITFTSIGGSPSSITCQHSSASQISNLDQLIFKSSSNSTCKRVQIGTAVQSNPSGSVTWGTATADHYSGVTYSGANLTATCSSSYWSSCRSSSPIPSGKYYVEFTVGSTGGYQILGVISSTQDLTVSGHTWPGKSAGEYGDRNDGGAYNADGVGVTTAAFTNGQVVGIAVDKTAGKLWVRINGTWQNSGDPVAGTNPTWSGTFASTIYWGAGFYTSGSVTLNTGGTAWANTIPSGYSAQTNTNYTYTLSNMYDNTGIAPSALPGAIYKQWSPQATFTVDGSSTTSSLVLANANASILSSGDTICTNGTDITVGSVTQTANAGSTGGNSASITSVVDSSVYSTFDRTFSLINGSTLTAIGAYTKVVTAGGTIMMYVVRRDSASNYTVMYSQQITPTGTDGLTCQYYTLTTPYVVPASGTFHVGFWWTDSKTNMGYNIASGFPRSYTTGALPAVNGTCVLSEDTAAEYVFKVQYAGVGYKYTCTSMSPALTSVPTYVAKYPMLMTMFAGDSSETITADKSLTLGTISGITTTFSPNANFTMSNGNLTAQLSSPQDWYTILSTVGKSSGKWYAEFVSITDNTNFFGVASSLPAQSSFLGNIAGSAAYQGYSPTIRVDGTITRQSLDPTTTVGDTVMVALDMDYGMVWFGKNGTWLNNGNPYTRANPMATGRTGTYYFGFSAYYQNSTKATANFGGSAWSYTPPIGFSGMNTSGVSSTASQLITSQASSLLPYFKTNDLNKTLTCTVNGSPVDVSWSGTVTENAPAGSNILPVFTGYTSGSFTISASSEYGASFAAWKSVDGTTNYSGWLSTNGVTTGWLKIDCGSANAIGSYLIVGVTGNGLKTWTLEGSNTGSFSGEQTTCDSKTNVPAWTDFEQRTYTLNQVYSFRYYRLNVASSQTAGYYINLPEIKLFGVTGYNTTIQLASTLASIPTTAKIKSKYNKPSLISSVSYVDSTPTLTLTGSKVTLPSVSNCKQAGIQVMGSDFGRAKSIQWVPTVVTPTEIIFNMTGAASSNETAIPVYGLTQADCTMTQNGSIGASGGYRTLDGVDDYFTIPASLCNAIWNGKTSWTMMWRLKNIIGSNGHYFFSADSNMPCGANFYDPAQWAGYILGVPATVTNGFPLDGTNDVWLVVTLSGGTIYTGWVQQATRPTKWSEFPSVNKTSSNSATALAQYNRSFSVPMHIGNWVSNSYFTRFDLGTVIFSQTSLSLS